MAYEAFYWSGFGDQYKFETLEELVRHHWMKFLGGVSDEFRIIDTYDRQRVDLDRARAVFNRLYRERMEAWYDRRAGNYKFRDGPVSNIRSHRRYGCYDRHPRTRQDRRETKALYHDEDLWDVKVKIRHKRAKLPTSWDDIARADQYDRNWKRHHKTQYKIQEYEA